MSDLLKQAIADAKAVRATALSNAKAALQEHFAPKLQSMLSEKLRAEVEGDIEGGEEAPLPVADVDTSVEVPEAPTAEAPVGSDNPEAPVDGQAPVEEPAAEETVPEEPAAEEAPISEEEMEEDMEESRGTESSGNYDVTQHGVSQVTEGEDSDYSDGKTVKGHHTEDPGKKMVKKAVDLKTPAEGGSSSEGGRVAKDNYKEKATGNQVKNIKPSGTEDPQGASAEVSKCLKKDDKGTSALQESEEEVDETSLDEILKELEDSVHDTDDVECNKASPDEDEEIDLNELLSEDDESKEEDEKEKKDKEEDSEVVKENISLKKELQEYRSTVVYLRDRINEINLLNAKLLYTNKLFKQASMTNEQKLKVIESFDLTKSVREAKLVYATLAESLKSEEKKTVTEAKKPVSGTVRTITEGLASKRIASTKPTNPTVLAEGAEMASRFQKLAGIRKK